MVKIDISISTIEKLNKAIKTHPELANKDRETLIAEAIQYYFSMLERNRYYCNNIKILKTD